MLAHAANSSSQNRENNFNLLRFLAAALVLLGHCYPLTGYSLWEVTVIGKIDITRIAVDVFFVISGFLVTGSLYSSKNIVRFCWNRILRIYPALIVSVVFTVLLAAFFTALPLGDYFAHPDTARYLWLNGSVYKTQFGLPGVFENLVYPHAVNGSLWTLPYEIEMYFLLAMMGCLAYSKFALITEKSLACLIGAVAILSMSAFCVIFYTGSDHVDQTLYLRLRFLSMFFFGAAVYWFRGRIRYRLWVVVMMVALIVLVRFKVVAIPFVSSFKLYQLLYVLFVGYIVLFLAYMPNPFRNLFRSWGDYSYGLYIYAFPIQQVISALYSPLLPWHMFVLAFPVTLLFAIVSWHWIEKPFLQLKRVEKAG